MRENDQSLFGGFTELPEDGLDIAAIFGDSSDDADPFAQVTPVAAPHTAQNTPQTEPIRPMQKESSVSNEEEDEAGTENLIEAAFSKQEEENTKKGLFERPPVFTYGSASEEIRDTSMTFEELRIAKSEDFPELAEGKKVSWTVEYGKTTKAITDPKGTTIAKVKEEIERSKDFLTQLKKVKDKNPKCLVKPKVTAQSKGIASYKGVFPSVEEAKASDKTICLIPAQDGRVYEYRKTEMGDFVAPKNKVVEFSTVRAGFYPALPLIPQSLMKQVVTFFRYYMGVERAYEALAHIYWDRENEEFIIHVPKQQVYRTYLDADLQENPLPEERYLHYADVHSHNSMSAKFSMRDDADEQATRIYIVIGRLDRFFPEISARMSCGGIYQDIDLTTIMEAFEEEFPEKWLDNVTCGPEDEQESNWPGPWFGVDGVLNGTAKAVKK